MAVTEWNFTAGDWGLLRGQMLTLEGALLNARYLNLLVRYSNLVDIACRSNMTNSFCSGIIGTSAAGVLKRPSYHVMRLYAEHALPVPLTVGNALAASTSWPAPTNSGSESACLPSTPVASRSTCRSTSANSGGR